MVMKAAAQEGPDGGGDGRSRLGWAARGVSALVLLVAGCGPDSRWHQGVLRPATDSIRAVPAADGPDLDAQARELTRPVAALATPADEPTGKAEKGRPRRVQPGKGKKDVPEPPHAPAVLPPTREQTIDLEDALRRAGIANPVIAIAREAVQASLAEQLRAQAMLLPSVQAGTGFNLHRGVLQTSKGEILEVNRQALYVGAGAAAVGAGTVTVPGVWLTAQLAEAWYEPKAARERVVSRQFDALATRNNTLLEVTTAYLNLAGAYARLLALQQTDVELTEVARVTAAYAVSGEGRQGDADRAQSQLLLLHNGEERAQEDVAVAAAELERLLDLDPSVRLRPAAGPIPLLQLVDPTQDLETLVQIALRNRPEIGARSADVAVEATLLREEQVRPFVPYVMVGFSAGDFGGGSDLADTRFGHVSLRLDCDVMAVWSLDNLGLGNIAVQRRRRAQVVEAEAVRTRVIDQIRKEVAQAKALVLARRRQVDLARRQVQVSDEGYRLDFLRTRNLKGLPIELLNNLSLLNAARQALVTSVIGYDQAQFQLFVALGQPPTLAAPLNNQANR
jgi:outer membrane protein TolC